jgi:hypothetical protein
MVIYHCLNRTTHYELGFRYLAFLPPSFILITGFLISNIYLSRHSVRDPKLYQRLLTRGIKLLILFTLLNVAGQLVARRSYLGQPLGVSYFFDHWFEIYISGDGRLAAFEVLLPIAYVLLLSPILILIDRVHWTVVPAVAVAWIALCAYLEAHGEYMANADLMSAGLAGFALGKIPLPRFNALGRFWIVALLGYLGVYGFALSYGQTIVTQILSASLALAAFYGVSLHFRSNAGWQHRLLTLGRYSLIAYIGQIAILQVLSRFTSGRPEPWSWQFFLLLLATLVLTSAGAEIVAWMRRFSFADRAYKFAFA